MTEVLGADGMPARRAPAKPTACPQCKSGPERRVNAAGFGDPVICCGKCGHTFEGATE
jgi:ribosomal protein L37AE/L43A